MQCLVDLAGSAPADVGSAQKPAVNVKKSVTPEYIVCLEDGKKLKMLKRYLRSRYNMTPDEYRAKWGLARRLSDGGAELRGSNAPNSPRKSDWAQRAGHQGPQARLTISLMRFDAAGRKPRRVVCSGHIASCFIAASDSAMRCDAGPLMLISVPLAMWVAVTFTTPPFSANATKTLSLSADHQAAR